MFARSIREYFSRTIYSHLHAVEWSSVLRSQYIKEEYIKVAINVKRKQTIKQNKHFKMWNKGRTRTAAVTRANVPLEYVNQWRLVQILPLFCGIFAPNMTNGPPWERAVIFLSAAQSFDITPTSRRMVTRFPDFTKHINKRVVKANLCCFPPLFIGCLECQRRGYKFPQNKP